MKLTGKVISGDGKGEYFTNLPWFKNQVIEKLGFSPYQGTLNLKLSDKVDLHKIKKSSGIRIKSKPGYCSARLFKAVVMKKIQGAVILPNIRNYPKNIVEIIAPTSLRETLGLSDGDLLEVSIKLK